METTALEARIDALEKKVKAQAKQLTILKDIEAIKKLQKAYGYYVEHMMYQEIVDCFADHLDTRLNWLEGQWRAKKALRNTFPW